MKTQNKVTKLVQLIRAGAYLGRQNIQVTFYPAYDKKLHSKLPDRLKKSLQKSKKETFNLITDGIDILYLINSKDVKEVKLI